MRRLLFLTALLLGLAAPASAQTPGVTPLEIPSLLESGLEQFSGSPATADPHRRVRVPRHPRMARNQASNIHNDAYQSDAYNRAGPLGTGLETRSALFVRECGSVTFDSNGHIVSVCVGLDRPVLAVLDRTTLTPLGAMELPPRPVSTTPFQSFAGGGYFYLDNRDRAVVPTSERHVLIVKANADGSLTPKRDIDMRSAVPEGDHIIAVMPDWKGRIWFATTKGVVGYAPLKAKKIVSLDTKEPIGNSFAVDETGGVFIVTNAAMYRFEAGRKKVRTVWRAKYPNVGFIKPGQTQAGSGTTPTLIGKRWVAITDNADPMAIRVYLRKRHVEGRRLICRQRVFSKGASSTDQSLIGAHRSLVVENNYGYTGPTSVLNGPTTTPGIERVDIDRDGRGGKQVWHSDEIAPSVVPKL
jgi:hypothetical protein